MLAALHELLIALFLLVICSQVPDTQAAADTPQASLGGNNEFDNDLPDQVNTSSHTFEHILQSDEKIIRDAPRHH